MDLESRVKWADRAERKMSPLDFFRQWYKEGIKRGRLEKEDSGLHRALVRKGLLDEAIPDYDEEISKRMRNARRSASRYYGCDLLECYKLNHAGLTRGELARVDRPLYDQLKQSGDLKHIPTKQTPLEDYREHYAGLTRWQVYVKDRALYERLYRRGMLKHIPLKPRRDFGDPVEFYRAFYAGLTSGELERIDPSLYLRLWKDGDLGYTFPTIKQGKSIQI